MLITFPTYTCVTVERTETTLLQFDYMCETIPAVHSQKKSTTKQATPLTRTSQLYIYSPLDELKLVLQSQPHLHNAASALEKGPSGHIIILL